MIRVLPLAPPDEDEPTDRRALADLVVDVEAVTGESEPWTTAVELVDDWHEVELRARARLLPGPGRRRARRAAPHRPAGRSATRAH